MSSDQSLEEVVLYLIDQTARISKRYAQRTFDERQMGITVDQWVLLKIIHEHPGLSQKALAEKAIRDGASVTRTLDLLEKKGLLQRKALPDNRRQYAVELSIEGQRFVNRHMDMVQQQRQNSVKGLSKTEITLLKTILLKMQDNMH